MKTHRFHHSRLRPVLPLILAVILLAIGFCGCQEAEDAVIIPPDMETEKEPLSVSIPMDDLIAPDLSSDKLPEELKRVWMGLFSSDGKLKKTFVYGNGITILNGKVNLNLTRDLVKEDDILALMKLTQEAESNIEVSTLEDLRKIEFKSSDIQGGESEVLYCEQPLREENCRDGGALTLNLSRPYAKIEITDNKGSIESIVMEKCPVAGQLGDALLKKVPDSAPGRDISYSSMTFQSGEDGKFWLYVPFVKFLSNKGESDDRALTLNLNNGKTRTVWITKYDNGKPIDISESDSEWLALWPGCHYPFTYNGSLEEEKPQIEIKDKIRIKFYYNSNYGKFSWYNLKINDENVKIDDNAINSGYFQQYDYTLSSEQVNNKISYQICDNSYEGLSIVGNLITDAYRIENIGDYTLFTLCGDYTTKMEYPFRFYCRDYDNKNITGIKRYDTNKIIPVSTDHRGYKYAKIDLPANADQDLDFYLIFADNSTELVMEYYGYPNKGINIAGDCVREQWDGQWYECFYFN